MVPAAIAALLVDVGNTHVRVAAWPGQAGAELPVLVDWETPTPAAEPAFAASVSAFAADRENLPIFISSVVPRLVPLLRSVWPALRVVDHTCPLPFGLALPEPSAIGPDRLCNMAAAAAAGYRDALVVDAGTATTFDLLLDCEFIGGLIAPGMALAAASLGRNAARLQVVRFEPCPLAVGRDTESAMRAGIYHTGVGGVAAVVAGLLREYGPLTVVLTGGLARYLPAELGLLAPDWTLRGVAALAGLDE